MRGDSQDWRNRAACRYHDPELFFPEGTAGPALRQADQARRICQSCPVQAPCLDFALRHGLAFGIWGGATAGERRDIRRAAIMLGEIVQHNRLTAFLACWPRPARATGMAT